MSVTIDLSSDESETPPLEDLYNSKIIKPKVNNNKYLLTTDSDSDLPELEFIDTNDHKQQQQQQQQQPCSSLPSPVLYIHSLIPPDHVAMVTEDFLVTGDVNVSINRYFDGAIISNTSVPITKRSFNQSDSDSQTPPAFIANHHDNSKLFRNASLINEIPNFGTKTKFGVSKALFLDLKSEGQVEENICDFSLEFSPLTSDSLTPVGKDRFLFDDTTGTTQIGTQIGTQIQIATPIETQIGTPIGTPIGTQIQTQIGTQIGTQIKTQIETPMETPIETQLATQIETPVETQLATQMETQLETDRLCKQDTLQSKQKQIDRLNKRSHKQFNYIITTTKCFDKHLLAHLKSGIKVSNHQNVTFEQCSSDPGVQTVFWECRHTVYTLSEENEIQKLKRGLNCDYSCIVLSMIEFSDRYQTDNQFLEKIVAGFSNTKKLVLVYGVGEYFSHLEIGDMPRATFDILQTFYQIQFHLTLHISNTILEASDILVRVMRGLKGLAHKRERIFPFSTHSPKKGRGVKTEDDQTKVWKNQLLQLSRVSEQIAAAIIKKYPTPCMLISAYKECRCEQDRRNLLRVILVNKRKIGTRISERIYLLFHCNDSGVKI